MTASLPSDQGPIVVFGAGCIGRGLMGERAAREGRSVIFIEAVPAYAEALRSAGRFTVRLVGRAPETVTVSDYTVLAADDHAAIQEALGRCAFAVTAVGGRHLPTVAQTIASDGLSGRQRRLPVLVCENWPAADRELSAHLRTAGLADDQFLCLASSVERMVRAVPDGLDLLAESGESALVCAAGLEPDDGLLAGLEYHSDLAPYYARKLYTNNAGHAVLAYQGHLVGCETLGEALAQPRILSALKAQLTVAAAALHQAYGLDRATLDAHLVTLIEHRYANPELADRVDRVGREPLRKLGPKERLVGLLALCTRFNLPIEPVCTTIAAALLYRDASDPQCAELQALLTEGGPALVLERICELPAHHPAIPCCLDAYQRLASDPVHP